MQFIKFVIVGVTNTAVAYGSNVFVLFCLLPFGISWDFVVGNTVSFFVGVSWAFYWNSKYVFVLEEGKDRRILHALIKTYIAYAFTGLVLSNALSYLWIDYLDISKYIAPLINLIITVPLNYIINKYWTFKPK